MKRNHRRGKAGIIEDIAKKEFLIEMLEERKVDCRGFREVAVWQTQTASEAAYRAGLAATEGEGAAKAIELAPNACQEARGSTPRSISCGDNLLSLQIVACIGCIKAKRKRGMASIIEDIAKKELFVETLEERRMDSLDFHCVAVWQVRAALAAAYRAGKDAAGNGEK